MAQLTWDHLVRRAADQTGRVQPPDALGDTSRGEKEGAAELGGSEPVGRPRATQGGEDVELAEPIGMTDYEAIRIAHAIGRRGADGMFFICIPPGSAILYRVVVCIILYMAAGIAQPRLAAGG